MKIPFTTDQFFEIFETYNNAVFPVQFFWILLGLIAIFIIYSIKSAKNSAIGLFLGFLWLWTGIVYHLIFFSKINPGAYLFGGLFLLQGIFFIIETIRGKLSFSMNKETSSLTGVFFIVFGLLIYPVISYFLEGSLDNTISLGLPCPTTIFTFGLLMVSRNNMSRYLLIIPSLWALIGTGAAVNFGVYQDYMMIVVAIIANLFILLKKKF